MKTTLFAFTEHKGYSIDYSQSVAELVKIVDSHVGEVIIVKNDKVIIEKSVGQIKGVYRDITKHELKMINSINRSNFLKKLRLTSEVSLVLGMIFVIFEIFRLGLFLIALQVPSSTLFKDPIFWTIMSIMLVLYTISSITLRSRKSAIINYLTEKFPADE